MFRSKISDGVVTQQLVEQVKNVFPRGSGLFARTLAEVSRAVINAQAVDAAGHQRQHPLRNTHITQSALLRSMLKMIDDALKT